MDLVFLKQLVVDCTKLIPAMSCCDQYKPDVVTYRKVQHIIDRHSAYTNIILCSREINAAGVINMFEKHIKPTIGVPFSIDSDQDVLCMSAEFQDSMINNGIRYKVSTTYHAETDGHTDRQNRELTGMFTAHELEGTAWLPAAPKIETEVKKRVSNYRGQSPFLTLHSFQPMVSSSELLHAIPVYSDPAQRHYAAAAKLNSAQHSQIKYANKDRRQAKYHV